MKIRRFAFFILVLLMLFATFAYAHPGGTDGRGGHTNHSTGEYHYHHGYSAHQHSDLDGDGEADCPYDFKDNTIHKDSSPPKIEKEKGSSSSNSASSFTDEYNRLSKQQSENNSGFPAYESMYYAEKSITNERTTESSGNERKAANREEVIETILAIIFVGPMVLYVPISIIAFVCSEVRDLIQKLKK